MLPTDGDATPSDHTAALVKAAAAGDAVAWKAIVNQFSGLVWSVARSHGLAHCDAEEAYQVAWLRLAENVERLTDPARVGAWLATTTRRESLRLIRLRSRITPTDDLDALAVGVNEGSPELVLIESERAAVEADRTRQLWRSFQHLSERCRQLLRALMASPPPSYIEVSAATGLAVGSIGPIRARCLARLRALLAEHGMTGDAEYS